MAALKSVRASTDCIQMTFCCVYRNSPPDETLRVVVCGCKVSHACRISLQLGDADADVVVVSLSLGLPDVLITLLTRFYYQFLVQSFFILQL